MINLLPEFEKRKLLKEYRLRVGVVVLCAVLILEIFSAIVLSPSYFLIDAAKKTLNTELALKKGVATSTMDDPQKKNALIKEDLLLLTPPLRPSDVPPSQILSEILVQKPHGIGINSFAYAKSGAVASAQLTGVAATREDLLLFQRVLKENSRFSDIKYAQSFITKKTDIDFQLTVTIK